MAVVEEALNTLIRAEPTITALIGAQARFYPDTIPQGATLPATAYQRIDNDREYDLTGTSNLARPRIQITIWAATATSRSAVKEAFRKFFDRCNAEWKDGTRSRYVNGVRLGGITIANDIDQRDPASAVFQSFVDIMIWHNEG